MYPKPVLHLPKAIAPLKRTKIKIIHSTIPFIKKDRHSNMNACFFLFYSFYHSRLIKNAFPLLQTFDFHYCFKNNSTVAFLLKLLDKCTSYLFDFVVTIINAVHGGIEPRLSATILKCAIGFTFLFRLT